MKLTADEALRGHIDRPRDIVTSALVKIMAEGPRLATDILEQVKKLTGASANTIKTVKTTLQMRSRKIGNVWFWSPPGWTKDQFNAWKPSERKSKKAA